MPYSPPQKILNNYQTNFTNHHDRGFYFGLTIGPKWIHSIEQPSAHALRFGGRFSAGWYISPGIALYASTWGHFLEQASLIAAGPGVAILFDGPNLGLDLSLGAGRVFNLKPIDNAYDFVESVLAGQLSLTKYWWLSSNTCLGAAATLGMHGLTLSHGSIGTLGWNGGLGLTFLFG